MGLIPGNENFPDVKQNYGSTRIQYASDTIPTNTVGTYYTPGNVRSVWMHVDTPPSFERDYVLFQIKDDAGTPNVRRIATMDGVHFNDGNKLDDDMIVITGALIPHEFAIQNPSSRTAITVEFWFNY